MPFVLQCAARQQITMDGVLAHAGDPWCEGKLCCVYQPGRPTGAKNAQFCATIADSKQFGSSMHALAAASGKLKCR